MTHARAIGIAALLGAVALAAGCQATLQEGAYGCGNDGACPSGWVCRASDQRCYRTDDDDAAGTGAPPPAGATCNGSAQCPPGEGCFELEMRQPTCVGEAGVERVTLLACTSPADCDSLTTFCLFQPIYDAEQGFCSPRCGGTPDCPGDATCIELFERGPHCVMPCEDDADCGDSLSCVTLDDAGDLCLPAGWANATLPLPPPNMGGMMMPPAP